MTQRFSTDRSDNRVRVNANGTWDSIVAYGKIAELDQEQQTAYEILAATYVLSFYEEAEETLPTASEKQQFRKQKSKLHKLARRQNTSRLMPDQPLRMFVTGPAGAGKSEQQMDLCVLRLSPLFQPSPPHTPCALSHPLLQRPS